MHRWHQEVVPHQRQDAEEGLGEHGKAPINRQLALVQAKAPLQSPCHKSFACRCRATSSWLGFVTTRTRRQMSSSSELL